MGGFPQGRPARFLGVQVVHSTFHASQHIRNLIPVGLWQSVDQFGTKLLQNGDSRLK